jgi:hypothetical protein
MGKLVLYLVGALAVIAVCALCTTATMVALFLQTMSAFTRETVVAEVIMNPIQSDNNGEFIEIEFTPYTSQSALIEIFNPSDPAARPLLQPGQTERYRLYGDVVAVRGPLITLHPSLQILGYENIYKLALIEGEYRRTPGRIEGSEAIINGGFDAYWWNANSSEAEFPYNTIINRITFSGDEEPGFYGGGRKRYQIVVTSSSITWNFIEDLQS